MKTKLKCFYKNPFALCFLLFVLFVGYAGGAEVSRAISGKTTVQQSQTENENLVQSAMPRNANAVSRAITAGSARGDSTNETTRQVGRSARVEAVGSNAPASVRRAGVSSRPTAAGVSSRARSVSETGAANRRLTSRAATTGPEMAGIEDAAAVMESCQAQYTDCMDQFCAVIDTNQKRCSCSNRLSSYSRVETAVKEANSQLNDVAQRIRYVGLSADEITAIMSATEAEIALQKTSDNTESRNMLQEIEDLIRTPETVSTQSSSSSIDLDLNFDSDADPMDMFSLSDSTTGSFSNLRGTDLLNAAKKRCQSVLTSCKAKGANTSQITGRYEIEIDKDCITYEKGLDKMNQTLRSNVRSATQMLQKARLAVLENHNSYDAKGCVGALEQCMQDEMVCGGDYAKCLDPTKRFIDESGKVVLGQNISMIRNIMANFDNSAIDDAFISSSWSMSGMSGCDQAPNNNGKCVVKYLLGKIGMEESTRSGLCRPVLDKCQKYTYDSNGKYNTKNSIVVGYIQRAMTNIRSAQEKIISDYASTCMAEIASCYSKQVTQINTWSSNANVQNVYSVLKGACRNVALTCSYAVFAADPGINGCPVAALVNPPATDDEVDATDTESKRQSICIENISDIFYQSMLCPENSMWVPADASISAVLGTMYPYDSETTKTNVHVNERCVCQTGYGVDSGACTQCPTGYEFNSACTYANASAGCPIIGCGCPTSKPYWDNDNKSCVVSCPSGSYDNTITHVCQKCSTAAPYWHVAGNACVAACPSETTLNGNLCQ